jgi:hypothetical protein
LTVVISVVEKERIKFNKHQHYQWSLGFFAAMCNEELQIA